MKIKLRPVAAIAAVALAAGLFAGCGLADNATVATVNGESIGKAEFVFYFTQMQNTMLTEAQVMSAAEANAFWDTTEIEGKPAADVARERALDEAVKVVLKTQKAAELGVSLTDDEKQSLQQQIGQTITNMGGKSQYESELKKMGTTAEGYERFMEQNLLAGKVDQSLSEDPAYAVSDEEATAYASENYIKAKHILLATIDTTTREPLDDTVKAEKKAKADELLAQIRGGADFDELMNANSEDPGLQQMPDGYVFGKGEMVKSFEDASYALEIGQVSDVVESEMGYHIIKREAMSDADVQSMLENARQEVLTDKIDALVEEWRKEAAIEVDENALSKLEPTEIEESAA